MKPVDGPAKLADVAQRAGVSLSTASRALGGSTRPVRPESRDRVLRAARELGYSVNTQARAVAKGTTNTVAVVVGDLADPYFSAIASGVIDASRERGLVVTISTSGPDPKRVAAAIRALQGQRPRAVIMTGTRYRNPESDSELITELAAVERAGGRVCLVASTPQAAETRRPRTAADRDAGGRGFRMLQVRNRDGAAKMADALVDLGYRDFCVLAGDPDLVTPSERTAGFVGQLRRRGVEAPECRVVTSPFSREGAIAALQRVLRTGGRPECIFAVSDVMAVGAMTTLREWELMPGTDVAVAGFDDIEMLQDVTPSLSTVALPLAQIGARALELALDESAEGEALASPVSGRVVLRDSTPGPQRFPGGLSRSQSPR
jgi:LacI family transcriptional regulator